jgi:hypothetical protein
MASMRTHAVAAAALLLIVAGGLWAADPPATKLPGVEWDGLTKAIVDIDKAATFEAAKQAYQRGCAVNRRSARLQTAYMKKMLKLGRTDEAATSAKEILDQDAKDGLALGVMAYTYAARKQWVPAFPAAMRSVHAERENPSIARNAAQLLVWHEETKRPAAVGELALIVQKMKTTATAGKLFPGYYKKAKEGYAKLADEKKLLEDKAKVHDEEAKKLEDEIKKLAADLKRRGSTYDRDARRAADARRDLQRLEYDSQRRSTYNSRSNTDQRRRGLQQRLREAERAMSKTYADAKPIKKKKDDLEKKWKGAKAQAGRLRREANSVGVTDVPAGFVWQPPAVDGVVTPDAKAVAAKTAAAAAAAKAVNPRTAPKSTYLAPTAKPAATALAPSSSDRIAEAEAADKLGLAKIYATSPSMAPAAKRLVAEILAKYPNTAAAKEAQELQKKLP